MLAIEAFFVLVVLGLFTVVALQRFASSGKRRMKGDAVKSPEEIKSHRPPKHEDDVA